MDERIKNIVVLLFVVIFAFGCMAKQIIYIPDPTSINDPKTIIYRILEEQPPRHTPRKIEFKDDKIKLLRGSGVINIHYDNIDSIKLYKFKNYYNILILNKPGGVIYRVVTYDLDKAKSFIDALQAIINRR